MSSQFDILEVFNIGLLLLKTSVLHDTKNKKNIIKNFKNLIVNLNFLYNNLYMKESDNNKIFYKINPTELVCINILIRTIQESINRGTFSELETSNIYRTIDQLTSAQHHPRDQ
jgi:hypothetical protein